MTTENGAQFCGSLRHFTTDFGHENRELALGRSSLERLAPNADPVTEWKKLPAYDAVIIPGSDIRHIVVCYPGAEDKLLRLSEQPQPQPLPWSRRRVFASRSCRGSRRCGELANACHGYVLPRTSRKIPRRNEGNSASTLVTCCSPDRVTAGVTGSSPFGVGGGAMTSQGLPSRFAAGIDRGTIAVSTPDVTTAPTAGSRPRPPRRCPGGSPRHPLGLPRRSDLGRVPRARRLRSTWSPTRRYAVLPTSPGSHRHQGAIDCLGKPLPTAVCECQPRGGSIIGPTGRRNPVR